MFQEKTIRCIYQYNEQNICIRIEGISDYDLCSLTSNMQFITFNPLGGKLEIHKNLKYLIHVMKLPG